MLKIVPPGSYDFGEPAVSMIPVSSRGLVGMDKRAAANRCGSVFISVLERDPPKPDEVAVHVIALGDGEHFGPNRNGDYFSSDACRKYHHTFVKHARWYHGHRNKDPRFSYGIVKKSHYNEKAGRIELLVYLNAKESAARRNGGLVASEELEKLASGEDLPVSMAARVPYDVCSGCGNRARTRVEYCDANTCVKYGGLKRNIGKTFEDGHTLCALNPICDWFDISLVARPADRIAWSLGVYNLEKAASCNRPPCGAELAEAEGLRLPPWYIKTAGVGQAVEQYKILEKLAEHEAYAKSIPTYRRQLASLAQQLSYDAQILKSSGLQKFGDSVIAATIKQGGLLSPAAFFAVIGRGQPGNMSGMYCELLNEPDILSTLECNPYLSIKSASLPLSVRSLVSEFCVAPSRFVFRPAARLKTASQRSPRAAMREYVLYQLASLLPHRNSPDFEQRLAIAASAALC